MKLFVYIHDGKWLTGKSVIIADSEKQAESLLKQSLIDNGLKDSFDPPEIYNIVPQAIMIDNGDY